MLHYTLGGKPLTGASPVQTECGDWAPYQEVTSTAREVTCSSCHTVMQARAASAAAQRANAGARRRMRSSTTIPAARGEEDDES